MLKKPIFLCLLAALIFQGRVTHSSACQYCRLAATDPEAARMAAAIHGRGGAFPLDAALNQFQGVAPSATLTAPPPTDRLTTNAADLPPPASRLSAPRETLQPAPPALAKPTTRPPRPAPSSAADPAPSASWADAGLLGLASAGGWFFWRTRRAPGSVS